MVCTPPLHLGSVCMCVCVGVRVGVNVFLSSCLTLDCTWYMDRDLTLSLPSSFGHKSARYQVPHITPFIHAASVDSAPPHTSVHVTSFQSETTA
jgi:hypothetical protein